MIREGNTPSPLLRRMHRYRLLYIMILPALAYFLLFTYYPLIKGVVMSFQKFRFVGDSQFVGFENYKRALTSGEFYRVFKNTLILGLSNVFITAFIPMIVALALNEIARKKISKALQAVYYLPHLFSWVVVGGIWVLILSPGGMVDGFRKELGLETIAFMTNPAYARFIFVFVNLWKQMGYVCIIYYASIMTIDPQLYEAAMLDGASPRQRAWHITIPSLFSTLSVVLMLNVMGALKMLDQIYVMRNNAIASHVDVLMYYVFIAGTDKFDYSYASAVSIIIFVFSIGLTVLLKGGIKYKV